VPQPTGLSLSDPTELYRLLVQGVTDYAIYALNPAGEIVSWNEGAQRLKGYGADEVIGQHLSLFYLADERDVCLRALSVAGTEGRFEGEGWRVRKNGTRFWASVVITALRDPEGRHIGFAKVTRDLTERKAAQERQLADARRVASEETARRDAEVHSRELQGLIERLEDQMIELEQQREELQTLTEELADTNAQLHAALDATEAAHRDADRARAEAESANQAKSLFLAVTSHELRTPINAVIGYTDLIADEIVGPLNDTQRKQLERVRMSARHLLALIENVLTLSRVEAGKESLHLESTDVCGIAHDSAALLAPAAAAKGLQFDIDVPDSACEAITDRTKVRQVIVNLLSNAVKFTDQGTVTLRVSTTTDGVRVAVRDTGIGIAASAIDRVFETYWRAEHTRKHERSGTGLGLSVAKQLAGMLGGTLSVDSTLGAGSTFTLQLPKDPPASAKHPGA
jgi:PAS domain S-box-containing protein